MDEFSIVFWEKMEAEYGTVSLHIRNILKIQHLCSQSLSQVTTEAITHIEGDMRDMVDTLRLAAEDGGTPLYEIYGPIYATQPEKFRFLRGEVMCLLDLANIMQKRGIKYFMNINNRPSQEIYDKEKLSKLLLEKILMYYISQDIEDSRFDLLKTIDIKVFSIGSGKYRAEALCPICQANGKRSKISFAMDDRQNWHIFSFTRHSNTLHYQTPDCSQRKRHRTKTITENHEAYAKRFYSDNSVAIDFSANSRSIYDSHSVPHDPLSIPLHELPNHSNGCIEDQDEQDDIYYSEDSNALEAYSDITDEDSKECIYYEQM